MWDSNGYAEGVAVSGNIALVADGAKGVRVIDISNSNAPREVASVFSFEYAFDVAIMDNVACVAAGESGLLILDIQDPANPIELSRHDTNGYAYEVEIYGKRAYVADAWEGIAVVDISNPAQPVQTGRVETSGWSLGLAVTSDTLISANGGMGSDIFELTNPDQPMLKSTYLKENSEGDAGAKSVSIVGDTAYIADTINGLRLVDITNLSKPEQISLYGQLSYARRLTIKGEYAFVATASGGSMVVVNIADPFQPYQVSKFQADGIASDVVVSSDYAVLGTFEDSTNCMTLINISDPTNPVESSAVSIQSLVCGAPRQLAVDGNLAYTADEWGLSIYDFSNPNVLNTIGRIELQQEGDQTVALSVLGEYAYVADAGTGLKIVNISDPANPEFVHTFKVGTVVGSVFSSKDTLYIGHYGEGLTVAYNPEPGKAPSVQSHYQTMGSVEEVVVSGTILVSSEGSGGLEILDVSNPGEVSLIQAIETPGFAWASVIDGDYIYTADGDAGILIYKKQPSMQASASPVIKKDFPVSVTNAIKKGPGAEEPKYPINESKVPSSRTCLVTSKADSGTGTLRECLGQSIAGETILFDPEIFLPQKPATITLENPLPDLDDGSVTVDASNAGVILDGQQQVSSGLRITSSYNTIMGIQFINFTMDGITLEFPGQFNQIGGDHFLGNGPSGQGNVFTGNTNGIRVLYSRFNTIKGNFVGTNAKGTEAGRLNSIGIVLNNFATHNTIGGAAAGEKNIVSNNDRGIDIASNSATNNIVAGNYIGTDVTGTKAIPNISWGVLIEVGGRYNVVGGTTEQERNIISGNTFGVCVSDYGSTQNTIIGNYIGLDVSGSKPIPNQVGVCVFQSTYNRIGGTRQGEANIISANSGNGVRFFGIGSTHALLLGNIIGLDATGQDTLPNNTGLLIDGGSHNMIGGIGLGSANAFSTNNINIQIEYKGTSSNWVAGNTIDGSPQSGVMISNNADNNFFTKNTITNSESGLTIINSRGITLHANSISGNYSYAIDLLDNGNLELAAPVIMQASATGVSGTACPECLVEIFSDISNQGLIFEGSVLVDTSGNFTWSGNLQGPNITATSTDKQGNTSSFSKAVHVQ